LVGAVLTGQGWETWHLLVAGWLEDSLMTGLISSFLWDSPIGRAHLILFSFQDLNRFFVIINSMILSLSTNLLDFIEDLSVTITSMCNALRLDDMHASLPDVKYRSPPWMIHRHRVPLFANQSLLCYSHVLAHSYASLPLKCKCSAHLGLSTTITALAVYQAWPCPQVWCCLIHHEGFFSGFFWKLSSDWLCASCQNPSRWSTSHELASNWNNTL